MAKTYTVEKGDSYWDIAASIWGGDDAQINENRKRLQELNGGKRLYAGDTLIVDEDSSASDDPDEPAVERDAAKGKSEELSKAAKTTWDKAERTDLRKQSNRLSLQGQKKAPAESAASASAKDAILGRNRSNAMKAADARQKSLFDMLKGQ